MHLQVVEAKVAKINENTKAFTICQIFTACHKPETLRTYMQPHERLKW